MKERLNSQPPEFGHLLKTYTCPFFEWILFYIFGLTVACVVPVVAIQNVKQAEERWKVIGIGLGVGALLTFIGWSNSRNQLRLFERGVALRTFRGTRYFGYREITEMTLLRRTLNDVDGPAGLAFILNDDIRVRIGVVRDAAEARSRIAAMRGTL